VRPLSTGQPAKPSGDGGDNHRVNWLYYLLIAAAVIVLINVVLVAWLAILNRGAD
jgi:hypothetical protein